MQKRNAVFLGKRVFMGKHVVESPSAADLHSVGLSQFQTVMDKNNHEGAKTMEDLFFTQRGSQQSPASRTSSIFREGHRRWFRDSLLSFMLFRLVIEAAS
jgi:hypothetical protein